MGTPSSYPDADERRVLLDVSRLPLIEVTFPRVATIESIDEYFDRLTEIAADHHYGLVADTRRVRTDTITPTVRARLNERVATLEKGIGKGRCLAEGVIIANRIMRMMFTAYTWTKVNSDHVTKAFFGREEARAWVIDELGRRGAPVPEAPQESRP